MQARMPCGVLRSAMFMAVAVWVLSPASVYAQWGDEWLSESMPSRPLVDARWDALSLPMGERDVIAAAKRMRLTREQLIAFEAMLPAYLEQACELRRSSNSALAAAYQPLEVYSRLPMDVDAAKKDHAAREAYMRTLARLDDALFDYLSPLLADSQQPRLLREKLRRARHRILSDSNFLNMSSRQKLIIEIGDLVDEMDVSAEQREALDAIVTEYESKMTARMQSVFDLVNATIRDWALADRPQDGPFEHWMPIRMRRSEAIRGIVELEYQWLDRVASVLSPEHTATLRRRHAEAYPSSMMLMNVSHLEDLGAAISAAESIDADIREQISQQIDDKLSQIRQTMPEMMRITRVLGVTDQVRVSGSYTGMTQEEYERDMPLRQRQQELQQDFFSSFNEFQSLLQTRFNDEQRKAVQQIQSTIRQQRASTSNQRYYAQTIGFGSGNVVTMVSMGAHIQTIGLGQMPRCKPAVLTALGLSEDERSGVEAVISNAVEHWREHWQKFLRIAQPVMQSWSRQNETFDLAEHEAITGTAVEALMSMQPMHASLIDDLSIVLEDAALAARVQLAMRWMDACSPPSNAPAPMSYASSSHYRTLISRLDMVDPVSVLCDVNVPAEIMPTVLMTLTDEAPAAVDRMWRYRKAVAESYALAAGSMRAQQEYMSRRHEGGDPSADATAMHALSQRASTTSIHAQQVRREHVAALAKLHERIAQMLPDDLRMAYADRVGLAAYPDAWSGHERASRMIDHALSLPEITEDQRQRVQLMWVQHKSLLREQARSIARMIDDYTMAEDMTQDARRRCALLFAGLEQAMFEREQAADAVLRLLRPILSEQQMRTVEAAPQ